MLGKAYFTHQLDRLPVWECRMGWGGGRGYIGVLFLTQKKRLKGQGWPGHRHKVLISGGMPASQCNGDPACYKAPKSTGMAT